MSAYTTTAFKKEAYLMPDVSSFPKRYVQNESELTSFVDSIHNSKGNINSIVENTGLNKSELSVDTAEMRARSYTDQTIHKTDIPDEIKNEFRQDTRMYEVLKNSEILAKTDDILINSDFNGAYSQFNRLLAQNDPTAIPLGYKLSSS